MNLIDVPIRAVRLDGQAE